MTLASGTQFGRYEIRSQLGIGGMGEVYRARDNRLNRDVAIKVLLDSCLRDPERMARFEREAQVLASLNHPNIASIYGLEEAIGRDQSGRLGNGVGRRTNPRGSTSHWTHRFR
jgi:serine/threonine protein kinase